MAAASQPVTMGPAAADMVKMWSFMRGVHAYNDKWEPRISEILCLQRQVENFYDQFAIAVMKNGTVVGTFQED